ncbi:RNA polymerase sigma factor SigJ [Yinghuangia sp. ASG 101]|uniref:RNA polymerase sigma factor SigJ n=1 Tax=Yinghuangia sp. ASG 101 TaxID=2896848 RepID=UPI001E2AD02A|nr:RNA polymerase sigma factor SigJ [Yinghuangia sp. ASG 101]UGQ11572.1 RNA polymerase sigma factor SigJ [Yinghuangia sp. ASG 101]
MDDIDNDPTRRGTDDRTDAEGPGAGGERVCRGVAREGEDAGCGPAGAGDRGDCHAGPFEEDDLARIFERERPRLLRVAYATTGSLAEAEDCVQDAWLRLQGLDDPEVIHSLSAWLTTTVGRLALDVLGSARVRRERYVGTWLPEPLVGEPVADPADRVTLDESVSMALLVVLEKLSPAQRSAFLLHDVFGLSFDEVAEVVGRSSAAVRQLASRARRQVARERPRFPPTRARQSELVAAFSQACLSGDLDALMRLLDPAVVLRTDGGGKVRALLSVKHGARDVAELLLAVADVLVDLQVTTVNGTPGLVLRESGGAVSVVAFLVDRDRIVALDVVRNPDKLTGVGTAPDGPVNPRGAAGVSASGTAPAARAPARDGHPEG